MDSSHNYRIIALIGTITFHGIIAVLLLVAYLQYSGEEERKWPPEDESDIVFGGEYVMLGDIPTPTTDISNKPRPTQASDETAIDGTDIEDTGDAISETSPIISSDDESPMTITEKETPPQTGPTKEELAEQERIRREKEEAQKKANISNRLKNGFSSSNKPSSGQSGSPSGNSTTGALAGSPGHNLSGRTAESWGRPSSTMSGSIRIKVRVNRQGHVIGTPQYVGGSGPAAANYAVRQNCISASAQSRFSVNNDATAEQVGIITWTFE